MNRRQKFMSSIILLLFVLLIKSCISIDIITPNRELADGELLVSNGEKFVLGFFSPSSFSTHKYLGIWLKEDQQRTVLWVANRDTPIIATSRPVLSIQTGNLLLSGPNQAPYWVTNISAGSSKNIAARLLDSGNFVLIQNGKNNILWQSFDYPTDTVLPNMKLGLDRKTGRDRFLTSWKSGYDPGMGMYSYRFDQRGSPQLFMMEGSVQRWRTGPWNGVRWNGVPEMTHNYFIINVTVVENFVESSVTYNIVNSSTMTRLVVDETGSVRWLAWKYGRWIEFWSAPKDQCDFYGTCGAYGKCNPQNGNVCSCLPGFEPKSPDNHSDGCLRKLPAASNCRNGEGFVKVERVKVPDTSLARVNTSMNMEACRLECLRDCSCTAYTCADVRGGGSGCITWYGILMDTREYSNGGQDLYLRVDALELAQHAMTGFLSKKMMEITMAAIAIMSLLFISLAYLLVMRQRKGRKGQSKFLIKASPISSSFEDSLGEEELDASRTDPSMHLFELRTIVAATNNFSSANKLGHGGFGSVYKGHLDNGQEIAVKRLSKDSGQGIEEFKNEVMLIAKLQHRNLVRLFGWCIDGEERMLIYEYLPNKSLDFFIFDEERRTLLDWRQRYEIIGGIARGILYLHQDSRLRIIHRDLKASNVLLDVAMNPKISDFGIARIFEGDQIEANTKRVVGTYGYMSPEYAMRGLYSIKSDVFSFGVLLLEIISGMRSNHSYPGNPSMNLIGQVWELWREEKALDIVDSSLAQSYSTNEVMRCIQIALLCVQECATDRPTMLAVVFMLGNDMCLPSPKKPAFILKTYDNSSDVLMAKTIACSVNHVTLTSVRAR